MPIEYFADDPILREEDDEFQARSSVHELERVIGRIDSSGGAAVALTGQWGSGKSSVFYLLKKSLNRNAAVTTVLSVNPWVFSGAETLVSRLFFELARESNLDNWKYHKRVAYAFTVFGSLLEPLSTAAGVPGFGLGLYKLLYRLRYVISAVPSLDQLRQDLSEQLKQLKKPLVILLDDLDRLQAAELAEFLKFVRLVSSLQNVVVIAAFDMDLVAKQIGTATPGSGYVYLEKLFTTRVSLAAPLRVDLNEFMTRHLAAFIPNASEADLATWKSDDIGVLRLIETPRDVKRLAFAVSSAYESTQGRICLSDLIAVEALRIKQPELWIYLNSGPWSHSSAGINQIVDSLVNRSKHVEDGRKWLAAAPTILDREELIRVLFPDRLQDVGLSPSSAREKELWLARRRFAAPENQALYLNRITSKEYDLLDKCKMLAVEVRGETDRFCELFSETIELEQFSRAAELVARLVGRTDDKVAGIVCAAFGLLWDGHAESFAESPGPRSAALRTILQIVLLADGESDERDFSAWGALLNESPLSLSSQMIVSEMVTRPYGDTVNRPNFLTDLVRDRAAASGLMLDKEWNLFDTFLRLKTIYPQFDVYSQINNAAGVIAFLESAPTAHGYLIHEDHEYLLRMFTKEEIKRLLGAYEEAIVQQKG